MTWSDLLKEYLSTATAFVITVFIVWALWNYTIVPIFPLFLHTLSYG